MKIKNKRISNFVNSEIKDYSLYTITSRGIPKTTDSLTNVQRMVLLHAPTNFSKTLSLVGDVFKTGRYHHGDKSLENVIQRLARSYDSSETLLVGDGFFGNIINNEAASARYTSIKINPKIQTILKQYSHLNTINENDEYDPLHIDFPIGLLTMILGIAVGYNTKILPRKYEDIQNYLKGKNNKLLPYFKDFKGNIKKIEGNTWLLESEMEIDNKNYTFKIKNIPPILKYKSFVKKLANVLDPIFNKIKFTNNSTEKVDIEIVLTKDTWEEFKDKIIKCNQILFTEQITFVDDDFVVQYNDIKDYLDQYIERNKIIHKRELEYQLNKLENENEFLFEKIEFLKFMVSKKRTDEEISEYLKPKKKEIKSKLEDIKLKMLSIDEIKRCEDKVKENSKQIKTYKIEIPTLIVKNENEVFFSTAKNNIIIPKNILKDIEEFELIDEDEEFIDNE